MTLIEDLKLIGGLEVEWNADLTNYSTFRLKSFGDIATVKSVDSLVKLLSSLKKHSRTWRVIGWGANQVLDIKEKDFLIYLDFPFDVKDLASYKLEYDLPASLGLNHLTAHAIKYGVKGWEVFTGIPASLGGAIYMNAGTALGEIGSLVKSVKIVNSSGLTREEIISPTSFSYRKNHFIRSDEIIISAKMTNFGQDQLISEKIKQYQEYRRQTQPLTTKNCGCVFKNASKTKQAGRLLDLTGLKGLSVGALSVSHKHANFMENSAQASANDFRELTRLINQQMELHWGVTFELEVKAV